MKTTFVLILIFSTTFVNALFADWQIKDAPLKLAGGEGEVFMRPVWSPDGQWLAFTKSGFAGILVLNMASGKMKTLTDTPGSGFGFRWSHGGAAIVTRTAHYDGRIPYNEVLIFDVAGGGSKVVSDEKTRFRGLPRWSADDQQVYILAKKKLKLFDSQLNRPENSAGLKNNIHAYLKNGKIVIDQANSAIRKSYQPVAEKRVINLVLSPDQNKIAFEVVGGNMFVMNIDGSGLVDLGKGFRPQWSPGGQHLTYMITEDDGHVFTASDIYTISIDGAGKTNLTNTPDVIEMDPSWSPNQQIAYDVYGDGSIYIVDIIQK